MGRWGWFQQVYRQPSGTPLLERRHHQQVNVRVFRRLAVGIKAKENNRYWIETSGELIGMGGYDALIDSERAEV